MDKRTFYHVWFATKKRRWLLTGEIEEAVKGLLWEIARNKSIELLECETMVDHVHLLLKAEPEELPKVMQGLKGVSSRRISQRFPELRFDGGVSSLWQRGYGAKAVPNEAVGGVATYIRSQWDRLERLDRPPGRPRPF